MTQLEFLEDTIKYYSEDTSRRSVDDLGYCKYSPKNAGRPNSEGCAIGRHLPTKLQEEFDLKDSDTSVDNEDIFQNLPKWMQELGQSFLRDVQKLHDFCDYWGRERGLSTRGELHVDNIKSKYNL